MVVEKDLQLSAALCEYLETIYTLSLKNPCVRITDISTYMGISKPSVNRAVNTLCGYGYLTHKPYGDIQLTDTGEKIGALTLNRHNTIARFLETVLKIPRDCAVKEAGYIERGISGATVSKMAELTGIN